MSFPAQRYLRKHYSELTETNKTILRFLHESFERLPELDRGIDVGTGPTLHQFMSASRRIETIDAGEFSRRNRVLLRNWKAGESTVAFDWEPWFEFVARLESITPSSVRSRTKRSLGNVFSLDLFSSTTAYKYPVVLSLFCAESIANDESAFENALRHLTQATDEEGWLVMTLLRGAAFWPNGREKKNSYPVYEDEVVSLLKEEGFSIEHLRVNESAESFCEGHILLRARKTAANRR